MNIYPSIKIPREGDVHPVFIDEKIKVLEPPHYEQMVEELNTVEDVLAKVRELRDAHNEIKDLNQKIDKLCSAMGHVSQEIYEWYMLGNCRITTELPTESLRRWMKILREEINHARFGK